MRAEVKPFSERNPFVIGAIGLAVTVGIILGALNYDKLPFFNQGKRVLGLLRRGGRADDRCRSAGFGLQGGQGRVRSSSTGQQVLVKFTVDKDIRLGDRTEAAIKTKGLLGAKILEVTSRGDGQPGTARFRSTAPRRRTSCPMRSAIWRRRSAV